MPIYLALFAIAADQSSDPVATVNGWGIYDNRGSCSAVSSYEPDTWIYVSYDVARNRASLALSSNRWTSIQEGSRHTFKIEFSNGSEYNNVVGIGMVHEVDSPSRYGSLLSLNADDFLDDFAGAANMRVYVGQTLLGSFSLDGTREMVERLATCSARSFRSNPGDPFAGQASPPTPNQWPLTSDGPARLRSGTISNDDYPAAAIRAGAEGTTRVSLSIGPDGRVHSCTVTGSSGHTSLDSTTCSLAQRRYRFQPAIRNGQPVASTYSQSVRWSLPPPPVVEEPLDAQDPGN